MKVKFGISTASLFLRKNNEEALPLLNEWGIPYAEVFLTSFSEYNPRFASALAAGKGEVRVHSVHVLNTQFEPQLYAEHPRDFRLASDKIRAAGIELGTFEEDLDLCLRDFGLL